MPSGRRNGSEPPRRLKPWPRDATPPSPSRMSPAVLDDVGSVGADDRQPTTVVAHRPRRCRLYRIREGQQIAGVCTGLAAYSEIRIDWIRTIFFLLAVVSAGLFVLVCFVIAFVLPVVPTREAWIAQMKVDEES